MNAVTPAQRRRDERMLDKLRRRLADPIAQQQARQSAQLAAEHIWRSVLTTKTTTASSPSPLLPQMTNHSNSSSTMAAGGGLSRAEPQQRLSPTTVGTAGATAGGVLPNIPSFDLSTDSSKYPPLPRRGGGSGGGSNDVVGQEDSKSEHSSERAYQRGWRRGLRETNEAISLVRDIGGAPDDDDDDESALDGATTLTEAITEEEGAAGRRKNSNKNKSPLMRLRRRRRSSSSSKPPLPSQGAAATAAKGAAADLEDTNGTSPGDPWMCGVCGKVFATLGAAERHEARHIQEVVWGLGWSNSNPNQGATTPTAAAAGGGYDLPSPATPAAAADIFRRPQVAPLVEASNSNNRPQQEQHTSSTNAVEHQRFRFQSTPDAGPSLGFGDFPQDQMPSDGPLVPKPRARTISAGEVRFADPTTTADQHMDRLMGPRPSATTTAAAAAATTARNTSNHRGGGDDELTMLLSGSLRDSILLADEALLDVCRKAEPMILTMAELKAERELDYLANDKEYYDDMAVRAFARKVHPTNRYRSEKESLLGKVQNKFVDAYQIMKEGDGQRGVTDQYTRKKKEGEGTQADIEHTDRTLYVNVMVRNSVRVVSHELKRLAGKRWEDTDNLENLGRFERFRVYAHHNMVKLAGIALASDFTPRRIAVQLSNDLYTLLTPRLKRRGVTIETEIEYRVGPYFVLAVNIRSIDWAALIKAAHKDVALRRKRWENEANFDVDKEETEEEKGLIFKCRDFLVRVQKMPEFDILAHLFYYMFYVHYVVYLPICYFAYYTLLGSSIRRFILSSVTDEIFFYVEKKGMEMEIQIRAAAYQAAFMLSALRELRAEGRALEKRRQESKQQEKGATIGPLLGPAIMADAGPAVIPEGFEVPENLEFVGLELDLPVGFQRLRWAFLSKESKFVTEVIYRTEAKYDDIVVGEWDKHSEHIGSTSLPDSVDPNDFIGATKEGSYLMPRSAFVAANMSYETHYIVAYNDYCFCLKKRSRNPDAPFGSTFIAWTQYLVINLGNNSCRLICSVVPEFPNGEPMVARQIRSGMRAGTGELFVLIGETIAKYADEYP